MSELAVTSRERDQCSDTFSTRIRGHVVKIILTQPECEPSGVVIPIISGVASGPEIHRPLAQDLAEYGHTVARVWQEGASDYGVRASKYVFQALVDGSFHHSTLQLPHERTVIPIGQSHGSNKGTKALLQLYEAGDTSINKALLDAATGLGGLNRYLAPLDAAMGFQQEVRHIGIRGIIKYRGVALEGLKSVVALRGGLFRELDEAMHNSIEPDISRLQEMGVEFAAIDHPHDRLVNSEKNRATYRRLGIPYVEVAGVGLTGHNVGLYHSVQTAQAINDAISLIHTPLQEVA